MDLTLAKLLPTYFNESFNNMRNYEEDYDGEEVEFKEPWTDRYEYDEDGLPSE